MIKLMQNAATIKKGSLNFMDQNGKVVGFNPRPDGNPLSFYVYNKSGEMLDTEGMFIEDYLNGLPYCFGKDGHIIKHDKSEDAEDKLVISLVPDEGADELELQIICMNSLYYTADFILSDDDRLLFDKMRPENPNAEKLAQINRVITGLAAVRRQVSQALVDMDRLRRSLTSDETGN